MSKKLPTFDVDMDAQELSKSKAKEFKSLTSKKERDKQGLFLAEGEKCVTDMLKTFNPRYLIATKPWIEKHPEICNKWEERVLVSDKRNIEIISSLNTPSEIVAVFEKTIRDDEIPVLDKSKIYLLLDEIQDPGNLGTIVRTCDWFGLYDIFASKNTADVYGNKVVQSTMGSLTRVRVHYLDLEELIETNREMKVIGTVLNGVPLKETALESGGLILMGNEGRGISENLLKRIDLPVTIPPVNISSHPDSLNVSIATAIILSHFIQ